MVGQPQAVIEGWPSAESLVELIDELKDAGYNIGVAQYIAAQDLVLALMAESGPLEEPEPLKSALGPLLCSSATEQADFQLRFDQWSSRIGLTTGPIRSSDARADRLDQQLRTVKQQHLRWWWLVLGVLALLIVLVVSLDVFNLWPSLEEVEQEPLSSVETQPGPTPEPPPPP